MIGRGIRTIATIAPHVGMVADAINLMIPVLALAPSPDLITGNIIDSLMGAAAVLLVTMTETGSTHPVSTGLVTVETTGHVTIAGSEMAVAITIVTNTKIQLAVIRKTTRLAKCQLLMTPSRRLAMYLLQTIARATTIM